MAPKPQPTWRFGLRQRVVTLIMLIPTAVVLVALPLLFNSQHKRAEAEFLEKLDSESRVLALALADRCDQGCLHNLAPPVDDLLKNEPDLLSIEILDRDSGEVLGSWGDGPAGAVSPMPPAVSSYGEDQTDVVIREEPSAAGAFHHEGHVFSALTPLRTNRWKSHPQPILRIRASSKQYNQRVTGLLMLALIPGLLAGALGLLLAAWFNRRLRGAIGTLMQATGEIANGRFDQRVSVRAGDELAPLGEAINTMATDLGTQRQALSANAEHLERTVAERTLELEKARAIALGQERIAAMGVLAAGVAHEIGNPLTAISTIVQGLRNGQVAEARVDVLSENLDRIHGLVRGLVSYARPPTKEWTQVSVNDVVRRTLDLLRLDPRAKNATFTTDLDPELPRLRSIEGKLQQVLLNLCLNALDAIGDSPGEVIVATSEGEGSIRVCVDDDGPGVPEELREKILEAFFTTRVGEGGTGLGLAVSASLLEELGGSLTVGDAPTGGARFEMVLPLSEPNAQ